MTSQLQRITARMKNDLAEKDRLIRQWLTANVGSVLTAEDLQQRGLIQMTHDGEWRFLWDGKVVITLKQETAYELL